MRKSNWIISEIFGVKIRKSLKAPPKRVMIYYQPKQCTIIFGKSLKNYQQHLRMTFDSPQMGGIQWPPWLRFIWPKHPWPFLETVKLKKTKTPNHGLKNVLGGLTCHWFETTLEIRWGIPNDQRDWWDPNRSAKNPNYMSFSVTFWHDTFGSTPTDAGSLPSGLYDYILPPPMLNRHHQDYMIILYIWAIYYKSLTWFTIWGDLGWGRYKLPRYITFLGDRVHEKTPSFATIASWGPGARSKWYCNNSSKNDGHIFFDTFFPAKIGSTSMLLIGFKNTSFALYQRFFLDFINFKVNFWLPQWSGNESSLSQWALKKKFERLIFPTKYVIRKSLKFSHWPSKNRIWEEVRIPGSSSKIPADFKKHEACCDFKKAARWFKQRDLPWSLGCGGSQKTF